VLAIYPQEIAQKNAVPCLMKRFHENIFMNEYKREEYDKRILSAITKDKPFEWCIDHTKRHLPYTVKGLQRSSANCPPKLDTAIFLSAQTVSNLFKDQLYPTLSSEKQLSI